MDDFTKYKVYAEDVLSGKKVACDYIKLACKRYLSWFERDDMYFDAKAVDKVVNFCSKLHHYTGEFNNKPFILSDWQFWIVCNIFGFKWKKNGTRVTRTAFIQVSRKNGKSTLLAALSAYCLIADGEANAQVVFAANSAKQAGLCFTMTSNFLGGVDPKGKYFKRYRDKIKFDATKSEILVTAADASKLDGLNCSMFCVDELEEAPNGKIWDVLSSSQGMRTQPLAIAICTAGFNLSSFCYEMRKSNIEVLQGNKEDDTMFSAIYELDKDDDYTDPNVWVKATPNLDVTVKSDYLAQQIRKSQNNPTLKTSVLTKLFNMWLSSSAEWISADYVMKSQSKFELSDFKDCYCYMGVDLGSTSDLTAVSTLIVQNGHYYFKNEYFLPSEQLNVNTNRELYRLWHKQGYLNVTDGNVCDYSAVLNKVL
jgi:phage terminase large subunit-like protein